MPPIIKPTTDKQKEKWQQEYKVLNKKEKTNDKEKEDIIFFLVNIVKPS